MDIQKEREAFEKAIARNIENFCDAVFDGKYYVMRENSRLNQRDKEFLILSLNRSWAAWQATKAQAVPECITDIQSWIAKHSFSVLDICIFDFPAVDANELAEFIASLNINVAVPEGFVLVPKEPTEEMIRMGDLAFAYDECVDARKIYKAMIEAQEQSHD